MVASELKAGLDARMPELAQDLMHPDMTVSARQDRQAKIDRSFRWYKRIATIAALIVVPQRRRCQVYF